MDCMLSIEPNEEELENRPKTCSAANVEEKQDGICTRSYHCIYSEEQEHTRRYQAKLFNLCLQLWWWYWQ
jgi:hypothetical protein